MGYFLRQGEGGALKKRSPKGSCAKQPCGEKAGQSGREGSRESGEKMQIWEDINQWEGQEDPRGFEFHPLLP